MPKLSAGLLLYRVANATAEVFIVHPGGPFWAKKDDGAWSIAKGEYDDGEDPWATALREFNEEVGVPAPSGERLDLGPVKQPSGKVITAYAVAGDLAVEDCVSNTFEIEWPRGSGKMQSFPEVDRAEWFSVAEARRKILKGQVPFLDRLMEQLKQKNVTEGTVEAAPADLSSQESLF